MLNKMLRPYFLLLLWANTAYSSSFSLLSLETSTQGRIGVYALNTANGQTVQYRENERFPMGCTSKVIGVGAILAKAMIEDGLLSKKINYRKDDLVIWSPITAQYVVSGMTIKDLCAAAIEYSDNTAMNLLVQQLEGLESMNIFAHNLGNHSFRQDHGWPEEAYSGGTVDINDSATPKDMVNTLQKLLFSKTLALPQQTLLLAWLKNNTTGNARIRAGVPKGWVVGEKTGTGAVYGSTNDLGVIWPPKCAPVLLGVYYTNPDKYALKREDIDALVTKMVIKELAQNDDCIKQYL